MLASHLSWPLWEPLLFLISLEAAVSSARDATLLFQPIRLHQLSAVKGADHVHTVRCLELKSDRTSKRMQQNAPGVWTHLKKPAYYTCTHPPLRNLADTISRGLDSQKGTCTKVHTGARDLLTVNMSTCWQALQPCAGSLALLACSWGACLRGLTKKYDRTHQFPSFSLPWFYPLQGGCME